MIQENDYILLKKGDFLKVFQVKPNKPIIIDRYKVKLNSLIGKPFGLQYEIKDQHFHLLVKNNHTVEDNMEKIDVVKDNRNIIDNILNQKLSKDDIEKLKLNEEISGKKIINCLIENSSSFNNKTEYSQEKYIRKKEGKYLPIYQVLRPTIRTLCHFYTQGNNKRKILNIRIDSLSQLLSYSNVSSSKNVMVVESCKGLLLAATIERLAGKGTIVNLTPNGSYIYTKDILDYMNFPNNYTKNIFHFPLERMDKIKEYINELNTKLSSTSDNFYIRKLEEKLKVALIVNDLLEKKNIDCLIIASKFQPKSILERAIKYMDSNRNFALYSPIQENLVECHTFLKKSQKALNIEITECFLREYQILPERTHPKVMMDSCSGFLLTGWTIEKNNEK